MTYLAVFQNESHSASLRLLNEIRYKLFDENRQNESFVNMHLVSSVNFIIF